MRKWIVALAVSLASLSVAHAAGPDDQYIDIYNEILQADSAQQNGDLKHAAIFYSEVDSALRKFKAEYPYWNPEVITFRTQYASEQLQKLRQYLPSYVPAPTPAKAPTAAASAPGTPQESPDMAALRGQLRTLTAANTDLENRLKEALSVQPAAVSAAELDKAQQKIVAVEKERDLLRVELERVKSAPAPAPAPEAPAKSAASDEEVRQLQKQLAALQKRDSHELQRMQAALQESIAQRQALQQKLETATASARANPTPAPAPSAQLTPSDLAALRQKMDEANSAPAPTTAPVQKAAPVQASAPNPALEQELEQLRAQVSALQAKPVPYTAEELAILNQGAKPAIGQMPNASPTRMKIGHTKEDLPPGAGELMAEAVRDVMAHDYEAAEKILRQILRQDENNVYVLAYLANAQLAQNHLQECDKTVGRALALDPEDPGSLYLLGVLRFQQARYSDALNALSLSAELNPTNASTQKYLGCALAEMGQRAAAESHLRKALEVDPQNAEANYYLAYIYATSKPPSPQLALWHYQRALSEGHVKNAALEKLLPMN